MTSTMDYNSIHGKGESNFSSPLSHRMPTVSAAQALQDLNSSPKRHISTSLRLLDAVLQNREPAANDGEPFNGGVSRGKVTEIYGPPGVGKTALGMQLAINALRAGEGVVWVDASHPLCGTRFSQVLASSTAKIAQSENSAGPPSDLLDHLIHISTPTLAHLIAFLSDPAPSNTVENISLIIIDSFSALISSAFPRSSDASATPKKPSAPNPSSRKFPILQYIINAFQKLAATRNIAIVVFSQCVTKMRPGAGAALVPSVNTTAWEQGLGCRVALYRDWGWDDDEGKAVDDVRLAQVIKAEGINLPEGRIQPVGFAIDEDGLRALRFPSLPTFGPSHRTISLTHPDTPISVLPQKRKLAANDLEIPDSDEEDDEDYGWAEEDEQELPPPPPQWQGSEDTLTPAIGKLEGDEEDHDEERDDEASTSYHEGGKFIDESKFLNKEIDDSEDELAL